MSDWSSDPVGAGLRALLLGNAAVAAQVASERIYPLRLPQKPTLPAIVLTAISEVRRPHLRGPGGLVMTRYQADAWAATHDAATALGRLIRQRCDGYAGTWDDGGSPALVLQVQAIVHAGAVDLFEPDILGGICRHSADYQLTYRIVGEAVLQ